MSRDEEENAVRILAREIGLSRLIEIARRLLEQEGDTPTDTGSVT